MLLPIKIELVSGYRMELLYRDLRRPQTSILMDGGKTWRRDGRIGMYDEEKPKGSFKKYLIPKELFTEIDEVTKEVIEFAEEEFPDHSWGD